LTLTFDFDFVTVGYKFRKQKNSIFVPLFENFVHYEK